MIKLVLMVQMPFKVSKHLHLIQGKSIEITWCQQLVFRIETLVRIES